MCRNIADNRQSEYLQVAAHAQHHLAVRKGLSAEGRMVSRFEPLLSAGDREREVAAMLGMGLAEAHSLMQACAA